MGTLATIPFSKLQLAEDNIRKSSAGPEKDAELKASIETHGVLVSLIVSPGTRGKKLVRAGKRRFIAVQQLVDDKKLPKTYELPCYILGENENAEEAALIENTLRADMHPIDEFESYSRLHYDHGLTVEAIAAHFGRPLIDIRKRLKLGNVAPELRQACREGDISVDTLAAFTSTDDMTRQLECYRAMKDANNYINAHQVRRWLSESLYEAGQGIAKLISLSEYEARGGKTSSDLFANKIYLHDTALVDELAKKYLSAMADAVKAEGWKWVDINLDYFNSGSPYAQILDPEPAPEWKIPEELRNRQQTLADQVQKLEEKIDNSEVDEIDDDQLEKLEEELSTAEDELYSVNEEIEQLAQLSDEQKSVSGALITVGGDGIQILRGRVKKEDSKKAKATVTSEDGAPTQEEHGKDAEQQLSQVLTQDLRRWHLAAMQLDLYYSTAIAADAMLFSIAWGTLLKPEERRFVNAPVRYNADLPALSTTIIDERADATIRELISCRESLNLSWLDADDCVQSLRDFRLINDKDKTKIMAWCAARTLSTDEEMMAALMEDCQTHIAKYWRPTATNFFKRAPKSVCLTAGAQMFEDDDFPDLHRAKARTDLAYILEERVAQMPISECWLPEQMRP